MTLRKITISFIAMAFAWMVNNDGMNISRNIKHDLCEALCEIMYLITPVYKRIYSGNARNASMFKFQGLQIYE